MQVLPDKVEVTHVVEMQGLILAAVAAVEHTTTPQIMVAMVVRESLCFATKRFQFMLKLI
jgi:hypothetical protein